MKSHAILLRPFQDVNHPFVQNTHNLYTTQLLMEEKNKVYIGEYIGFSTTHGFGHPRGSGDVSIVIKKDHCPFMPSAARFHRFV